MTDWQDRAACKGKPGEWFFPNEHEAAPYEAARRVCNDCPVKAECLAWALENGERHGMLGGASPRERSQMKRGGLFPRTCRCGTRFMAVSRSRTKDSQVTSRTGWRLRRLAAGCGGSIEVDSFGAPAGMALAALASS